MKEYACARWYVHVRASRSPSCAQVLSLPTPSLPQSLSHPTSKPSRVYVYASVFSPCCCIYQQTPNNAQPRPPRKKNSLRQNRNMVTYLGRQLNVIEVDPHVNLALGLVHMLPARARRPCILHHLHFRTNTRRELLHQRHEWESWSEAPLEASYGNTEQTCRQTRFFKSTKGKLVIDRWPPGAQPQENDGCTAHRVVVPMVQSSPFDKRGSALAGKITKIWAALHDLCNSVRVIGHALVDTSRSHAAMPYSDDFF